MFQSSTIPSLDFKIQPQCFLLLGDFNGIPFPAVLLLIFHHISRIFLTLCVPFCTKILFFKKIGIMPFYIRLKGDKESQSVLEIVYSYNNRRKEKNKTKQTFYKLPKVLKVQIFSYIFFKVKWIQLADFIAIPGRFHCCKLVVSNFTGYWINGIVEAMGRFSWYSQLCEWCQEDYSHQDMNFWYLKASWA